MRRVAIIGGGISGLAAASYLKYWNEHPRDLVDGVSEVDGVSKTVLRLSNSNPITSNADVASGPIEFEVFESAAVLGGVIQTIHEGGRIIECGADCFLEALPYGLELSKIVGIDHELIPPEKRYRHAMVVARGIPRPIPAGLEILRPNDVESLLKTRILSPQGRLRAIGEYFIRPKRDDEEETVESFAVRRLGREAYERLIEPIVGGIFTADAGKLSMKSALPKYVELERKYGGLIRSSLAERTKNRGERYAEKTARGARYSLFVAPKGGMDSWIAAIARYLPANAIHRNSRVDSLSRDADQRWTLHFADRSGGATEKKFDALIVALPATASAKLFSSISPTIASSLASIEYADSAVVCMILKLSELAKAYRCFGVVVPRCENRDVLAISLTSLKYPGRVAEDELLVRVFIGGALRPELLLKSDAELFEIAWREVHDLLKIQSQPVWHRIIRWRQAMPQYHVGHADRVALISKSLHDEDFKNVYLAGNAFEGVGIPYCIRSAKHAVASALRDFSSSAI